MLELTKLSVGGATPEQQSELSAKLVEVNQYYLDRINAEWVESWKFLAAVNGTMLSVDRMAIYQDWLRGLSQRRMQDVTYAMEVARTLGGIDLKLSLGLTTREDLLTSTAA
jgi:hypothetical protein